MRVIFSGRNVKQFFDFIIWDTMPVCFGVYDLGKWRWVRPVACAVCRVPESPAVHCPCESMDWQSRVRCFDNTSTMLSNAVTSLCCGVCYYPKWIHFLKSVCYLQVCTIVTYDAAPAALLLYLYTGNTTPNTGRNWRKLSYLMS